VYHDHGGKARVPLTSSSFAALFVERIFVGLVAFADETGTHDATGQQRGAEVAGVMGYVSRQEDWEHFNDEWQSVLNPNGVEVFHMSEFVDKLNGPKDPDWPYHGWDDTRRDSFIRALIGVALDHAWFAVGGFLNVRDYDTVSPDWLKIDNDHPYYFCFQLFFDALLPLIEQTSEPQLPPEEQIAFFFDQHRQFEDQATKAFHLIKALRDTKDRFGTISFATKRKYKPLQAADMLAYIVRQAQARRIREGRQQSGQFDVLPRSWEELITSKRNVAVAYYDASNLPKIITELEKDRLRLLGGLSES
jgi:hypothetical protein